MSDASTVKDKESEKKPSIGIRKMRFKHKLMLIVFSLLMMTFLRTGFVFFIIGMLPCIVAYYMDISKQCYTFQSIFAANLSGMMPYITKMIHHGPSSTLLQEIMGNSTTWIVVYGAALVGWLLVKICPTLAQAMVISMHRTQHLHYAWIQKKLESEWGDEVKQFSGEQAPPPH